MLQWRKKVNKTSGDKSASDIQKTILDEGVKQGFIEISRYKRNNKNRPQQYFLAERPLADIRHTRIEEMLLEEYGGGEYFVRLQKTDGGKDIYVASFTYLIDGPQGIGDDNNDSNKYEDLAAKALEKQLNSNSGDLSTQLLLRMMDANSGKQGGLLEQVQILKEIGELTKSQVPVIPPESETAALLQAVGSLVGAFMANRNNQQQPAIVPTNAIPQLAEIRLPSGGNGHDPNEQPKQIEIKTGLQDAFFAIYLNQFKDAVKQGDDIENFVGMIESMTENAIYWIPEPQWHPIIADFVRGYSKMDLALLNSGFERLMTFAEVDKETAVKIRNMLLSLYQTKVSELTKSEDADAGEQG